VLERTQSVLTHSVLVSSCLASLLLGCGEAPTTPFAPHEVEAFEAALVETQEMESAAGTMIAVADGEGHRWTGVMGLADVADARPVTEETLFRSASIAKTFTGALILSLHEDGLLSIDDPLSRYVDTVPGAESITLRMLLQHTSGIANYAAVPAYREAVTADPSLVFTYEELVAIAVEHGPDFPPGAAWNYSNTGYILLGIVAESVVGRTMHEEMRARFFEPLGMHDTRPTGAMPAAELWTGYRDDGAGLVEVRFESTYVPDGGYTTSLDDMMIWSRAFLGGRLHRPETLALAHMTAGGAILDSVAQAFGLATGGYGLGIVVASDEALGPMYAGAGNADGVRTFLGYLPDQDLAFAVAVNVGIGSVPIVETLSATAPMLDALRGLAAAPEGI